MESHPLRGERVGVRDPATLSPRERVRAVNVFVLSVLSVAESPTVNSAFLTILTFVAVVTACAGIYSIMSDLYLRDRSRVSQRVDDEFRKRVRARAQKSLLFKDLRALGADSGIGEEERSGLRRRFEAMVEQSGMDLTPQRLLIIAMFSALGLGLLGGLVRHNILVAAVGATLGAVVPIFYVNMKRNARLEKLLSQLPDA